MPEETPRISRINKNPCKPLHCKDFCVFYALMLNSLSNKLRIFLTGKLIIKLKNITTLVEDNRTVRE